MKKQLLAIALLTAGFANAQVWTQNFNAAVAPALPAGWMQNNVDGLIPSANISAYNFGVNAGVTRNITTAFGIPNYNNALITTSSYSPAGVSNDWVITPSFTVPPNAVFNWEATAFDPVYSNGYEVRISTTGTTVSNFTVNPALFTIAAEVNSVPVFMSRGVSLNAYAGQTVYLAIHDNSNDQWQAAYDNFAVTVPANATDGSITTITGLTRYMTGAGNQPIAGTFKELGYATATTAIINYKVNGGAVVTQTFTPNVPYYGTAPFTFSTQANFALGTNNVKVWVNSVNGVGEVVNTNDTAKAVVYVASVNKPMNALVEEFSSSTCVPCANLNVTLGFDALLNSNTPNSGGRVNVIKNQVNWPSPSNDPSYNPDVTTRVNFYGINAAPTGLTGGNTTMVSHNQAEIDAEKNKPAYADITATLTLVGGVLTGSATVTPYVSIPASSPVKVYQTLAQSSYSFANPTTIQNNFFHAARKSFPDANGVAFTPVDGVAQTVNFTHTPAYATIVPSPMTPQGSNSFWTATNVNYEYIVWIQDIVNKQVLQSGSAQVAVSTGVVKFQNNSSIGVYPNPAKDYATLGIKLNNASTVDVAIYDATGKLVYSNKGANVNAGENEIRINTSEFATGVYNVMVSTTEGQLKDKLIIVK